MPKSKLRFLLTKLQRAIVKLHEQRVRLRTLAPNAVAAATFSLRASVPPHGVFFALQEQLSHVNTTRSFL